MRDFFWQMMVSASAVNDSAVAIERVKCADLPGTSFLSWLENNGLVTVPFNSIVEHREAAFLFHDYIPIPGTIYTDQR